MPTIPLSRFYFRTGRKEWFFILDVIHTQAGDEWRSALRLPNGELTERVQSNDVERNFWRTRQQNGTAALDAYRLPVCSALRELITSYKIRSVMELGPGWGNYTFFLAEQGVRLTCEDISPDNIDYLASELKTRMGVSAKMICAPWENAQIEPNGNDMVFAYNCFYRMRDSHFQDSSKAQQQQLYVLYQCQESFDGYWSQYFPIKFTRQSLFLIPKTIIF